MRAISLVLGLMLATTAVAQTNFSYTGSLQTYTVPPGVTNIRIVAAGAQGGSVTTTCAASGGLGAQMEGDFSVTPGEVLSVLVGQQGLTNGSDAGGGGGSFVVRTGNVPLLVAGGGGGATNNIGNCGANRNGINATITTSGTASGNGLVAGGTNGNGGGASGGSGGGGGGFLTNGVAGTGLANNNGKSYLNGGAGGTGNNNDFGGYGGGGAGWFTGGNGGGGGGYSGGATSGSQPFTGGGGGGSYNAGTNQINTAGFRTGNGSVTITAVAPVTADITGTITNSLGGGAMSGIIVANSGAPSTSSNGSGVYSFTGLAAGSYTITPSVYNYVFSPLSRTVNLVAGVNATGQDFVGTYDGRPDITDLRSLVVAANLSDNRLRNSLFAPLDAALTWLNGSAPNRVVNACGNLAKFIATVRQNITAGKLPAATGNPWVDDANDILALSGCPTR